MILTSPDGQWIAIRSGRGVTLRPARDPGGAPTTIPLARELDDVDLALVGPPNVLVAIYRGPSPYVALHPLPMLDPERSERPGVEAFAVEPVARHDLDTPMRLAAVTGPRVALVSRDDRQVLVVRAAGRALSTQAIDPGSPVEFVVGLERNQLLLGLLRGKLRVWDAISGRPLAQLQLQLVPPPRRVGGAQGHLWVTRPGSDEVTVYRLSDGRAFRHLVGAPIEDVVCHPLSPVIVLVTARGLVRLQCYAHSPSIVEAPAWHPATALAQLVHGEDIALLGLGERDSEPWQVPISGAGTPLVVEEPPPPEPAPAPVASAADKLRAMRVRANPDLAADSTAPIAPSPPSIVPIAPSPAPPRPTGWRDPLVQLGSELARGTTSPVVPELPDDSELGELARRLGLAPTSRRALVVLYAAYLVGEPALSIARLSQLLGDWSEPLGQGELGALAMLRRRGGRVALRAAVTDLLDGLAPRTIRLVGGPSLGSLAPGVVRIARAGKSDAAIEHELASQLGRIAVLEGAPAIGVLEARLYEAPALALVAPPARPLPWPRAAGLIVVADPGAPSWVAALPALA